MSPQADYIVANGTGAAVRSDINGQLAAIVSNNSGATEPATMYAYQWWADTTTGLLKIRNAANSAWVTIGTLASANLGLLPVAGGTMTGVLAVTAGTAALPGIAVSGDTNTGIYSPGADQLAITTGGTSRLAVSTTAVSSTLAVDVPLGAVGTPSITFTGDLNTGIYSPGADQVAISTGGTGRLFVDASGNQGLGVTPSVFSVGKAIEVGQIGNALFGATSGQLNLMQNAYYDAAFKYATTAAASYYQQLSGSHIWYNAPSGTAGNTITFTQAMTLDANGRLLVGTTSSTKGGANNFSVIEANYTAQFGLALCSTQTTGTANFSQFVYNGTINGSISSNGTTTTYAITSDYRLKENVIPVYDGIARFKQLKPSRFNFIGHPESTVDGFLAHEVQQIVSEAVVGEKDATNEDGTIKPQGIDQSKLVPLLTAALQEAIAKIEALETRLSALEAA